MAQKAASGFFICLSVLPFLVLSVSGKVTDESSSKENGFEGSNGNLRNHEESRKPKEARSSYAADVVTTVASDCTPRRQSPIDLVGGQVSVMYNNLVWSGEYFQYPVSMQAVNNEETIRLSATFQNGAAPKLSGGPLSGKYVLSQIHFHWGTDNSKGSEHTVLGASAPMEIHCVHIREGLTPEEANKRFDGYAVVAYFVQVTPLDNLAFKPILDKANQLKLVKSAAISSNFPLANIMVPFTRKFYTYGGSLTTPPYTEAVTWIISGNMVMLSQKQLDAFRYMAMGNHEMENNYRQTQPLNGRTVFYGQ